MPTELLSLLGIQSSAQSIDYVNNKKQFQLHSLLTEQRHPKTWNLSFTIKKNIEEGLRQIFSVDEDITKTFKTLANDKVQIEQAADAVSQAIRDKKQIYVYGCGATGRLAKQLESAIWRPFWKKIKKSALWDQLKSSIPENIEDYLIGEMTGADRALISALEGFEDLELVGKLQLQDRGITRGDVVFCITEGGETSSVIGTILAALKQYGPLTKDTLSEAKKHLYFIYNNPDDVLEPFSRSRSVLDNPAVTRINLTTGPQAVTGSTRMQATTSETYFMGVILEAGIHGVLTELLSGDELAQLGFPHTLRISDRLLAFESIQKMIMNSLQDIAQLTESESETYRKNRLATYFAKRALLPVFIDCAERSPTFHLYPLDTMHEKRRKCWLQIWTDAQDYKLAWKVFLGRDFRGLEEKFYRPHFETQIDDPYLKKAALNSLSNAGSDQEKLYDFSFSGKNITNRGPQKSDLGILTCVDEEIDELADFDSPSNRFIHFFKNNNANVAIVFVGEKTHQEIVSLLQHLPLEKEKDIFFSFFLDRKDDPLNLKRQTLLKILLNGHSTAVMARLGKVVGNTMTGVKPSNLKLIGRATHLIMSHVNDTTAQEIWTQKHGPTEAITYAQANAVLFNAMDFLSRRGGQSGEVELSIFRILEALKKKSHISWDKALSIAENEGLEKYLERHNPALRQ